MRASNVATGRFKDDNNPWADIHDQATDETRPEATDDIIDTVGSGKMSVQANWVAGQRNRSWDLFWLRFFQTACRPDSDEERSRVLAEGSM